ncbi:MAG: oligosaccharide repeat unit polymerase [Bacteroidaceae bacterium]|nr:oligosaccharide repeat unit polymerase [Bacteroidaceae bacterium]
MIIVPFLFFSALAGYWYYRHRSLDICVYMAALYAFTSLIAIVVVVAELMGRGGILFDNNNAHFGFIPTVLYCFCIALALLPFSMIYGKDIKRLTISAPWAVDLLSWMFIALSFLSLYLVADSTLDILQGDLGKIRNEAYAGVESPAALKAETLPFIVRFFYYFNASTLLALPIFFYNICFRQKSWWFNGLLLFASLSMPIVGIQQADRTEIVFYGQMMLFCIIFFYRFFNRRIKWMLAAVGVPLLAASLVYLTAVSQARFDNKGTSESSDRALQYAGQGFLNFCYFYDHANSDYVSVERELPFIHHFFFHVDSNAERREERTGQQGFFISVFPTFLGDLLLDASPLGMIIWVIGYFLLLMLLFRRSHREEFDISELLMIYFMAIVPLFGIFYYRFFFFTYSFMLFLVVGVFVVSKYKLVLK